MNWLIEYPNGKTDSFYYKAMSPDLDSPVEWYCHEYFYEWRKIYHPPALSACGEARFCYAEYDNASK